MKKPRAVVLAITIVFVALLAWPAVAQADSTELVSVSSDEAQGDSSSYEPSINADGSIVAFTSTATNLVAVDTNEQMDVFVRNLSTGETELVSVSSDEAQGNDASYEPSISADGSIVAFTSTADNLVDGLGESPLYISRVYVRYLLTGETMLVSDSHDGSEVVGASYGPAISADGTTVAFTSVAANLVGGDADLLAPASLVGGDTDLLADVFVYYLSTGETKLVSVNGDGIEVASSNTSAAINADGSVVAFVSDPIPPLDTGDGVFHLVPGADVFIRNMETETTVLVSVAEGGVGADNENQDPSISADGSVVAFMSAGIPVLSLNGAAAFAGGVVAVAGPDIFVRDLKAGTTELVSVAAGGVGADNVNVMPSVNADGSIVAFVSGPNTGPGVEALLGPVAPWNVFVRDRGIGITTLLSLGWDGSASNGMSFDPSINADGSRVAFFSAATNLVPGDLNGWWDVFVATYVAPKQAPGYPNRYEQTDPHILYSGNWETGLHNAHSQGSNTFSTDPKGTITITFKGTRLDWIAALGPLMGKALVSIDGGEPVLVDLFSEIELFQQLVWSTGELEYGVHTITITFPEGSDYQEGKGINVDAIDIWGVLLGTT